VDEIGIFRHYDPIVSIGNVHDAGVGCSVLKRKVEGVNGIKAEIDQATCNSPGQLRINQEFHAARG